MLNEVDRNLLERTKQDLLANPRGFNMDTWGTCIAHRMSNIELGYNSAVYINQAATKFNPLFGISKWPEDLTTRYIRSRISLSRDVPAAVGAEAIDRFVAADGDGGKFHSSKAGSTPKLIPAFFPTSPRKMAVVKAAVTTAVSFLVGIGCVTLVEHLMR